MSITRSIASKAALAAVLAWPAMAAAEGTTAGTPIASEFTLQYERSSGAVETLDNNASPVSFDVGFMSKLVVASSDGGQVDIPDGGSADLTYTVTNFGNYAASVQLEALQDLNAAGSKDLDIQIFIDDGAGTLTPYSTGATLTLAEDESLSVVARVQFADPYAPRVGASHDIALLARLVTGDGAVGSSASKTSGTPAPTIIHRDGSGSHHEAESDGAHSAQSEIMVAGDVLVYTASVAAIEEDGVDCGRIGARGATRDPDAQAIPGACVEYVYSFSNQSDSETLTDLRFDTALDPNLVFIAAAQTGFPTGAITAQPAARDNCRDTSCDIALRGASLAPDATASLTIHALIQ